MVVKVKPSTSVYTHSCLRQWHGGGNVRHGGGNVRHGGGNVRHGGGNVRHGGGNVRHGGGNVRHGGGNVRHGGGNVRHGGGNVRHGGGNPAIFLPILCPLPVSSRDSNLANCSLSGYIPATFSSLTSLSLLSRLSSSSHNPYHPNTTTTPHPFAHICLGLILASVIASSSPSHVTQAHHFIPLSTPPQPAILPIPPLLLFRSPLPHTSRITPILSLSFSLSHPSSSLSPSSSNSPLSPILLHTPLLLPHHISPPTKGSESQHSMGHRAIVPQPAGELEAPVSRWPGA
ncbi:unnamed protein product [Closterium sp. Naga37s-1]|nr:unnamed protein product [Closterium sp. Naga37s-1]